jgi:hypothetical protein
MRDIGSRGPIREVRMPKFRIAQKEIDLIRDVSDRMAKRMNAKFVVDPDKVEIVDDADESEVVNSEPDPSGLNLR